MPIDEAFDWEKQGLVLLMGCEPGPPADEPPFKFQCTSCGHQWGIPLKDLPDKNDMLKVVDEFLRNQGHDCFMKLFSRCGRKEIAPVFLRLLCLNHGLYAAVLCPAFGGTVRGYGLLFAVAH